MKTREPNKLPGIGRFSTLPAAWIDEIYTRDRKRFYHSLWYSFQIRFIYLFVFLPLVAIDLVLATGAIVGNVLKSIFTRKPEKSKQLKERRSELADIIRNSFVVTLFGIFGIFSPKFVIKYFTPHENEFYDASEDQLPEKDIVCPKHEDDLTNIISLAQIENIKFIVSADTQMQTLAEDEKLLNLKNFNAIEIAKDDKSVRVGAGVRWVDLQKTLNAQKLALEVAHENDNDTIADAVAINSHSSMLKTANLADGIIAIEMVKAHGTRRFLRVTPSDELFKLVLGGRHLFGVVTHVIFRVVPNCVLQHSAQQVALQDYNKFYKDKVKADKTILSHEFELSVDPYNLFHAGVAINYRKQEASPVMSKAFEGPARHKHDSLSENLAKSTKLSRKLYSASEANQSLKAKNINVSLNDIARPREKLKSDALMSESVCLQEYFIPRERLHDFMEALAEIIKKNNVKLLQASLQVYHSEDAISLNPQVKGEACVVAIRFNQQSNPQALLQASDWLTQVQGIALSMNGTYKLQDQKTPALGIYRKANKRFDEVFGKKKMYDPSGVFTNHFFKQMKGLLMSEESNPVAAVNATQKGRTVTGAETSPLEAATTSNVYGKGGLAGACTQFATNASQYAADKAARAAARQTQKDRSKVRRRKEMMGF